MFVLSLYSRVFVSYARALTHFHALSSLSLSRGLCFEHIALLSLVLRALLLLLILCLVMGLLLLSPAIPYNPYTTRNDNA